MKLNAKQKKLMLSYNERLEWSQKANAMAIKLGDAKMRKLADAGFVAAGIIKRQIERENKLRGL